MIVLFVNLNILSVVNSKQNTEYVVKTLSTIPVNVSGQPLYGDFIPATPNIDNLIIEIANITDKDIGNIIISIIDASGNEILKYKAVQNDIINNMQHLSINVNSISFNINETYKYCIYTESPSALQVVCNSNSLIQIKQVYPFQFKNVLILFVIGINILLLIFFIITLRKNWSNVFFVTLSLISGIIVCFIITPCSMNDEYRHFLRVYDITQGNIRTELTDYSDLISGNVLDWEGGKYPVAMVPEWLNNLKYIDVSENYLDKSYSSEVNNRTNINKLLQLFKPDIHNNQLYMTSLEATWEISILAYLPQVLLVLIGKLFNIDNLFLFYLARLGNVIICTILFYATLKIGSKHKEIICLLYFMPSIILFRSSCTTDGFLFSLILLLIVYIIYIKDNKLDFINYKRIIITFILSAYIAVIKLPYAMVVLVLLILSQTNFIKIKSRKKYLFSKIFLPFAILIGAFLIYKFVDQLSGAKIYNELNTFGKSLVGGEHITYIFQHPVNFITLFWNSFWSLLPLYEVSIKGLYTESFGIIYILTIFIVSLSCKKSLNSFEKLILIFVLASVSLSILFVGYTWQKPDLGYIWGVGWKYYIPLMPLLFLALPISKKDTQIITTKFTSIFISAGSFLYIIGLIKAFLI